MKKISLIVLICFVVSLAAEAQTQQGYVRTLEKPNRPSQGIEGATINILEYPNALVTKKGGKFSFSLQGKKQGDAFKVSRIQKKGYTLVDKHITGRKYSYSASVPIEIVMVSDKQLAADTKLIEDKAYAKAKKNYDARIAELERQLAEKTISEHTYYAERERLTNDYDSYIQLIGEMAERYAMTDYKGLSDLNREIMECIENAELERADSLINSKGDFDKREQELRAQMEFNEATAELLAKSQQDAEFKLNDLAQDYYNKYTILAANYQNDSAAYFLIKRADLDPTNVKWQNEAGNFIENYLADYELAMNYYQKGLSQAIAQYGEHSDWVAWSCTDIGSIYYKQDDYSQAMEYFQKSLTICEDIFGTENPEVAVSYDNIGNVHISQGNYAQALECFQKALAIDEHAYDTEHPDVASSYSNISAVYYKQGDYDQALEYSKKALGIRERFLGSDHPDVAGSYDNIGILYSCLNDYDQALEYYQKALTIKERVFGTEHPEVALTYNNIGGIYSRQGDFAKGMEYFQKSLAIKERIFGMEHFEVLSSIMNIGKNYSEQGDIVHASECCQRVINIIERIPEADNPHIAQCYASIGGFYAQQNDFVHALEYTQKALSIFERVAPDDPLVAPCYASIGGFYAQQNDFVHALEYTQKALSIFERVTPDDPKIQYLKGFAKLLKTMTGQ